jgi:hypothetical protein
MLSVRGGFYAYPNLVIRIQNFGQCRILIQGYDDRKFSNFTVEKKIFLKIATFLSQGLQEGRSS